MPPSTISSSMVTCSPFGNPWANWFRQIEPPLVQPSVLFPFPANQTSCGMCGAVETTTCHRSAVGGSAADGVAGMANAATARARPDSLTTRRQGLSSYVPFCDSMTNLLLGLRLDGKDTVAGAQTERRGGAGPAGACLAVRTPPAAGSFLRSIVVEDRAEAALLDEQRIAAEVEQVQVEPLAGFPLVVALDLDGDGLRRFTGGEGQRAGLGGVVLAGLGGAVHGAVRHRHRLIVGDRERDREGEQGRLILLALRLAHSADADTRLVVRDGGRALTVDDGCVGRVSQVDEEGLVRLGEAVAVDQHGDLPRRLAGRDDQCARGGLVVAAGRRRAVGGGVLDGHVLGGWGREGHA